MTFEDLKGCLLRYELDGDDDIDHTRETGYFLNGCLCSPH